MLPFREVFFNIDQHLLFYGMAALATAVFVYGMVLRWRFWSSGWREARDGGFDVGLVLGRALANTSFFRRDLWAGSPTCSSCGASSCSSSAPSSPPSTTGSSPS
ncbi:MAG: hypothetical protein MZV63_06495 [Marinilabiliales bacterium]|nr:hypothetical protein [Marinilabiliales bacterium]